MVTHAQRVLVLVVVLLGVNQSITCFGFTSLVNPRPAMIQQGQDERLRRLVRTSSTQHDPGLQQKNVAVNRRPSSLRVAKDDHLFSAKESLSKSITGSFRTTATKRKRRRGRRVTSLPRRAVKIYVNYAGRLWNETNPEARQLIAHDKNAAAVRHVQHLIRSGDYDRDMPSETRDELVNACDRILIQLGKAYASEDAGALQKERAVEGGRKPIPSLAAQEKYVDAHFVAEKPETPPNLQVSTEVPETNAAAVESSDVENSKALVVGKEIAAATARSHTDEPIEICSDRAAATSKDATETTSLVATKETSTSPRRPKKQRRSILFGAVMGMLVACWVFSGNYIFTGLFTLMTILGQLEYYRMIINTGVYPARRISVVGACSMFLTALFTPNLHQICLPMCGLWAMIWFLTMKRSVTTIPEVATTFTGMFYLGYVPSFWVRIRLIGAGREPTRLAPVARPILNFISRKAESSLPGWVPQAVHLPITTGAIFIFWTWLCLAFSDVGAYFVGKNLGKTKLGTISPAAGATSPNKTVEGVLGGCAVSAALAILGAWVQRWPYFWVTGAIHGVLLGILGLLGDLTASMLKRDAGLKDFGDLIPEHGGIMDRVDSFIWTAPYSWLVCGYVVPALKAWLR